SKINAEGVFKWTKQVGTSGHELVVTHVDTKAGDNTEIPPVEGSVYIGGYYKDYATFGNANGSPLSYSTISDLHSDLFLARLEQDGDWQWVRNRGANSSNAEKLTNMTVDNNGRIYAFAETNFSSLDYSEDFNSTSYNQIPSGWSSNLVGSCVHGVWPHNIYGNTSPKLEFADHTIRSQTPALNTSNSEYIKVSLHLWEGRDVFSENTDPGEDFEIYYINSSNQEVLLEKFYGGGHRTNAALSYVLPASAAHSNFRMVFRQTNGSGGCYDYWHIDDLKIIASRRENIAFQVSSTLTSPVVSNATNFPLYVDVNDMVFNNATNRLILSATNRMSGLSYCQSQVPLGAFVASLNMPLSPDFSCEWVKHANNDTDSVAGGVTLDNSGKIYQIGTFTGDMTFNQVDNQCLGNNISNETIQSHGQSSDVFMVSYHPGDAEISGGATCWVTGGNFYDGTDSYPAIIGEAEDETGVDISSNGLSSLYITGNFRSSIIFGEEVRFSGQGKTDVYVSNWGLDGRPFQTESWPVGKALTPPNNAYIGKATLLPDFYRDGEQIMAIEQKLF